MPKVAIIKQEKGTYYDYDNHPIPISSWLDVTEEDLHKLVDATNYASCNKKDSFKYSLVYLYNSEEMLSNVFSSAEQFVQEVEKQRLVEQKKREKYEAEKEAKALERKRKQLEKLKKELGD